MMTQRLMLYSILWLQTHYKNCHLGSSVTEITGDELKKLKMPLNLCNIVMIPL